MCTALATTVCTALVTCCHDSSLLAEVVGLFNKIMFLHHRWLLQSEVGELPTPRSPFLEYHRTGGRVLPAYADSPAVLCCAVRWTANQDTRRFVTRVKHHAINTIPRLSSRRLQSPPSGISTSQAETRRPFDGQFPDYVYSA